MKFKYVKDIFLVIILYAFMVLQSTADTLLDFEISGNERISDQSIIMFSEVNKGDVVNLNDTNNILKNIYNSNFFENVSIKFSNNILYINVKELPIIESIFYEGIKAERIKKVVYANLNLKQRSSYNKNFLQDDLKKIKLSLQNLGYYFSEVDVLLEKLENNKVNITYKVNLGKKAKIKNIKFIGNKIFKEKTLKSIIASEEYKFWKFISGKNF